MPARKKSNPKDRTRAKGPKRPNRRARGTGTVFFHEERQVWIGRRVVGGQPVERSHKNQETMLRLLAEATPPGPTVTVGEWARRWLLHMKVRPNTRVARESIVRTHIVPVLGAIKLAALTKAQLELALDKWAEAGLEPGAVRSVFLVLKTCLYEAVRTEIRPDNPARLVKLPKIARTVIDVFTEHELSQIVATATTRPAARAVALMAAIGCRIGEACALDVADYDRTAHTVSISRTLGPRLDLGPPKSEAGTRTVVVPTAARRAVELAIGRRTSGPLFPTRSGARAYKVNVRKGWKTVLKRLGIRYRCPHQLRHSVVTHALAKGIHVGNVARDIGDTPREVVKTYTHATEGRGISDAMDEVLVEHPEVPPKPVKWAQGGRGQKSRPKPREK